MELFIVNNVDYTNHIVVPSYKVQSEPVFKTWEDATYTNHSDLVRWRVKGSFKVYFDDISELDTFLNNLENSRGIDNYCEATCYDNYKREKKTSRYLISISLVNDKVYYGNKKHDGYEVKVEEQ